MNFSTSKLLDNRRLVWSLEHLESLRYIRTIKEIILHIDHYITQGVTFKHVLAFVSKTQMA